MNLENQIRERFINLNEVEDICNKHKLDELGDFFAKEKDSLIRLQYLMYLAMKEQYPDETIGNSIDMFEKYIFEIKVTKK